jgi:hypothetical protein
MRARCRTASECWFFGLDGLAVGELSDHECMHHLFMVARQLFVLEYIRISSSRAPLL